MRRLLPLLVLPFILSSCLLAAVGAGTEVGITAAENRSPGRKVDDNVLYTNISDQFVKADQSAILRDVTFNIRYGRVMLTGTVKSEDEAQKAVATTWKAKGVEEVINETIVNPDAGFFDTASDSLVKRNLESRLLITKGVWVINYSIDVQQGNAYLIGRVKNQAELDRVMNIAKTTKGVKKVVSHLQINNDVDRTTPNSQAAFDSSSAPVTPVNEAPIPQQHNGPIDQSSTRSGGYNSGPGQGPNTVTSGTMPPEDPISSSPH